MFFADVHFTQATIDTGDASNPLNRTGNAEIHSQNSSYNGRTVQRGVFSADVWRASISGYCGFVWKVRELGEGCVLSGKAKNIRSMEERR